MKAENSESALAGTAVPATLEQKSPEPIVFAKRDRKPAIGSITHFRAQEDPDYTPRIDSEGNVLQEALEEWILRRSELSELEEEIALALSNGATVEKGVHVALLEPARDFDGSVYLRLVIR